VRALLKKPPDQPALERFQAAGYRLAILTKTDGVVSGAMLMWITEPVLSLKTLSRP